MDALFMDFSSLVGEQAWAEFQACYGEKRVLARPQEQPDRFRSLWSDWEFEAMNRFTLLAESDTFRLIMRGKQVPDAAFRGRETAARLSVIRQLWDSGVSVNFARAELYSNPVLELVRSLEAVVRCAVRAHYFATPAQSQALGVHADHDDVLILQVEGEKTWDVYHGSNRWPPEADGHARRLRENPPETLTLGTGGWLYLPKGVYHEVRNESGRTSRHFTIGFHELSWASVLERALGLARATEPVLRQAVAVGGGVDEILAGTEERLLALRPFVGRALTAEHYGERLPDAALISRGALEGTGENSRFRWRSEVAGVRFIAAGVEISLPYRSTPLVLRAELAPQITDMARGEVFWPRDLAGADAATPMLCKFLTNLGVLQLDV